MSITYTEHYEFGKQEDYSDLFSMKVITDNWDSLDELLYAFDSAKQNTIDSEHPIDGTEVRLGTYSKATTKQDIAENDTVKTALGKVEKRVEDNENNILSTCCVGTCTTAGNVAAKIVTIDEPNWVLRKGCIIGVKFTYSNGTSTDNVTLNVNNTGDKSIYFYNSIYTGPSTKACGTANAYIYYMYDGTYWCWINYGFDSTYSNMTQSEATTGTATTGRLISAKVLSDTIDEKIQPLENNISSIENSIIKMVAHTSANGSTALSYDTNINDFNIGGANSDKLSGSYLVICTNWSTTPAPYVGLLTFSGGTSNKFVKTDVVTGFTPTITIAQNVSNATIAISGAAKISIYATK